MNAFQYRDGELFCEDVAVAPLAEEFGTPLWIYSKAQVAASAWADSGSICRR